MDVAGFFRSQLCVKLPVPTKKYTGQTIIVTGSNVGIGLETARYLVSLDAAKVILAVRNTTKGETAAKSIAQSTGRTGVAEVWPLDLTKYDSVKSFAERAKSLERLDILINNAGILVYDFEVAEDNESTITVNAVSAMLLSILLLPKLRDTSVRYGKENVLTFTGSFVHFMTEFPERKAPNILAELANKDRADMKNRYFLSPEISEGASCNVVQILRLQDGPTPHDSRTRKPNHQLLATRQHHSLSRQPRVRQD